MTVVARPAPAVDDAAVAERRRAARALLLHPLIVPGQGLDDELRLVRRHQHELTRTFAEGLGYRLVVEPQAARLFKAGLGRDGTRPMRKRSGAAFTPRVYALLCLTIAALTRAKGQLLVDELVAQVRSAAADADIAVDLDAATDRRALHAALVALVDLGVLHERDGDLEHWADQRTPSLLDVRRELLGLLVAAPLSSAATVTELLDAAALPSAAGGARVAIRRRLVEMPLLSVDELTDDQGEWWRRNRNREREWFSDRLELELELRAEGALAVDPEGELTDVEFPGRGSTKHLALLLLEQLATIAQQVAGATGTWRAVSSQQLDECSAQLIATWREGLKREHRDDPRSAVRACLSLLTDLGLVRASAEGLLVHAAAARYVTRTTLADAGSSGERSLFDHAEDAE